MTDHERSISGLPANEQRVEHDIANGMYGRDDEVLDLVAPTDGYDNLRAYYQAEAAIDKRVQALIDTQRLADLEFPREADSQELERSLGAPALYLVAA